MRLSTRAVNSFFRSCAPRPERRRRSTASFPFALRKSISESSLVGAITMSWQWKVDESIKQTEQI
jgi:hypothetical protein